MQSDPAAPAHPEGAPEPAQDYLEITREFWQRHTDRKLTREDAREMAHNLLGFFSVLREWTIAERERDASGRPIPESTTAAPGRQTTQKFNRSQKKARIALNRIAFVSAS